MILVKKNTSHYWNNKKILITGGNGFLGKHIVNKLKLLNPGEIIIPTYPDYDLRKYQDCKKIVKSINIVINLAANVGGIGYNMEHPAELFEDNILIGVNMMKAARESKVEKYVAIGTICSYPKYTSIPFKEDNLFNGYPENTNAPYGLAKLMQLVQSQAYRKQYGFNSIFLLPVNMYGPGDNFNPKSSHVIPSLIRKFIEANDNNLEKTTVWGTGKATREFLYIEDAAEGILLATEFYNKSNPVNLGTGFEITIKDLANKIKKLTEYKGRIVWDTTKPDGQPRRMLDTSRAKKEFGFESSTPFEKGLKETILWFKEHRSDNRV